MLKINNITAGYTKENMILKGVDLTVSENEVVALLGQNGSGKSTLAKAVMNMVPFRSGELFFCGADIRGRDTSMLARGGIGFFMQGGRIYPNLTVEENMLFAGGDLKRNDFTERLAAVKMYFELFNNGRGSVQASYLSGGEQHQLALAMVLMRKPKFLILDEPSAGLSPANVKGVYEALRRIRENEVKSILIIEQNVNAGIAFSDRVVLLQDGHIAREEISGNLNSSERVDEFFFGELR